MRNAILMPEMLRRELIMLCRNRRQDIQIDEFYQELTLGHAADMQTGALVWRAVFRERGGTFECQHDDLLRSLDDFADIFLAPAAKLLFPESTSDESLSLFLDEMWASKIKPMLTEVAAKLKELPDGS